MTKLKISLLASALAFGLVASIAGAADVSGNAQLEKNKQLALALTAAMAEKNVDKASSYLADGYIQHNPNVPTGKAGFVGFFGPMWAGKQTAPQPLENPPVEVVAQGDLVMMIFKHATPDPVDPSKTYDAFSFDAYRITNGKVSEHWDNYMRRAPAPAAPK